MMHWRNIRNMFLDIEGSCFDLEIESGAKVERSKDGIFTITGDLSEIRAARCILINWKDENEKRVASETRPAGAVIIYRHLSLFSNHEVRFRVRNQTLPYCF
jgi:hypothetical protein